MNWRSALRAAGPDRRAGLALAAILLAALGLRLYWVLIVEPAPQLEGGDGPFYLTLGRSIVTGDAVPSSWSVAAGPLYPLYLAAFYLVLPGGAVVQAARIGQAVLDTITCAAAFDLGRRIFDSQVALLAASALALDLRFIVQAGFITTETLFTTLLVVSVWAFVAARQAAGRPASPGRAWLAYAGAGILFGLAALVRAASLLLPMLCAGMLLLPRPSREHLRRAAVVLGVGAAVVAVLTARTYLTVGQVVVVSTGLESNFWMGSRGDGQWHGVDQFNADRADLLDRYGGREAYLEDAFRTIAADPAAYVRLLAVKAAAAYLQPHGTVAFPGESLKILAGEVLRGRLSLGKLVNGDAFWPKLIIYLFHYAGLIGGIVGMWLARRDWLKILPLALPIAYFSAVYTLLTIIPRYLFPIMPFYTILAAYAGVSLLRRWAHRERRGALQAA